jgi:hypothetical protein
VFVRKLKLKYLLNSGICFNLGLAFVSVRGSFPDIALDILSRHSSSRANISDVTKGAGGWTAEALEFEFPVGANLFSSPHRRDQFWGHSPPSSAEVKNRWIYSSTPPTRLHDVLN